MKTTAKRLFASTVAAVAMTGAANAYAQSGGDYTEVETIVPVTTDVNTTAAIKNNTIEGGAGGDGGDASADSSSYSGSDADASSYNEIDVITPTDVDVVNKTFNDIDARQGALINNPGVRAVQTTACQGFNGASFSLGAPFFGSFGYSRANVGIEGVDMTVTVGEFLNMSPAERAEAVAHLDDEGRAKANCLANEREALAITNGHQLDFEALRGRHASDIALIEANGAIRIETIRQQGGVATTVAEGLCDNPDATSRRNCGRMGEAAMAALGMGDLNFQEPVEVRTRTVTRTVRVPEVRTVYRDRVVPAPTAQPASGSCNVTVNVTRADTARVCHPNNP